MDNLNNEIGKRLPAGKERAGGKIPSAKDAKERKTDRNKTPLAQARSGKAAPNKTPSAASTVSARNLQKWERVQAQLKAALGQENYASWFGAARLESVSKSQIAISVPTLFLKSWIKQHYSRQLLELWVAQLPDILRVDILVRSAVRSANGEDGAVLPEAGPRQAAAPNSASQSMPKQIGSLTNGFVAPVDPASSNGRPISANGRVQQADHKPLPGFFGSPLDPNFTFANFVEGASNRLACAAARSVAESDGSTARFNPLLIHAGVGLGKTHLLQAIAWAAAARDGNLKILYLTAEYFMWRFATAIRDNSALSFKESLRDIDLLLIDDMQFLQGKSIQQEFCHLLNALIDSAKQVVVAADRPPIELESLDDRVKSRLKGGVALEVGRPDFDMRRSIVDLLYNEARKEDETLDIPDDILEFVATKVSSSGRDIEGAFNQLLVQHRFSDGPLDPKFIEKTLGSLVLSSEQKRIRIEDIQKVVARHYNVTKTDLLSIRRTRAIVRPRQIAMYLAKMLTPRSLPEIGRRFGGRDHTTVLHAVRKVESMLADDTILAREIELLKRMIEDQAQ